MPGFAGVSERELAGRAAVVVGGSRGIGREVARLLAHLGAGVVVNGRDEDAVSRTVAGITHGGDAAVGFAGSPADEHTAEALMASCVDEYGRLDILVNCAGIPEPPGSSILTITGDEFRLLMDSHLGTTFHTCRAAAPRMVGQRSGAIVNTSSFAFLGDYGGTGYPAGKGAVNGLTVAIAAELAEHGVRVNVVCPGAKTRISTGPDYEEQIRSLNRRGLLDDATARGSLDDPPPEYVAPLYAYLVSDLAAGVTGQILIGAGGFVGRFDKQTPALVAYPDHTDTPPWTLPELHAMFGV
jgi:3-oxoacyl-[acyl-carrier protein] reductase